ncbi:MFS transporter [Streptomyces sp. NPDC056480]|uniref:MFS transporter n=1 Tax=Streptomyces sp. NPDC056480 TaxID=3345833 RepID=UPI0036BB86B6
MNRLLRQASAALIPSHPQGRVLALSAVLDATSTGALLGSFVLYFVDVAQIPSAKVALASTIAGAAALLVPVPVGRLADRYGAARFYILLLVLRGLAGFLYASASGFASFAAITVLFTTAHRASLPIQQSAVVAAVGGQERARTMAAVRAIRNVGLTLGSLLGAAAFAADRQTSFTLLFLGSGTLFVVAALIVRPALTQYQDPQTPEPIPKTPRQVTATARSSPFRDRWFMALTAANAVFFLHDTLLSVMLPVWVIEHTDVPAALVPLLSAVNTVLTVLLQVYVARFAEGFTAARRLLLPAGTLLVCCCLLFALAGSVPVGWAAAGIVVAVIALTVAENLHAVAAWELSAALSPPSARTEYLSTFSLALAGQKAAGPSLLVIVLMPLGPAAWAVLGTAFAAATLASRTAAHRSAAERTDDGERTIPHPPPHNQQSKVAP